MPLLANVLADVIQTGTDNYINYLSPRILLIAVANSIGYKRLAFKRNVLFAFRSKNLFSHSLFYNLFQF